LSRRSSITVLAVAAILAGCGSTRHRPTTSSTASLASAWHQVVVCARAHGMPGLQDPRIDERTGKAIFPAGLNIPAETEHACQHLVDRLVPNTEAQPPTPAQMAALLRFARCLRSHGIADWPDPRADGTFVADARIAPLLKSAFRSQLMACEQLNPDPHGRVYFSHP